MPTKKIVIFDKPPIVQIHEIGRLFKGHPKGVNEKSGKPTIGRDYGNAYLRFEPDPMFKNEPSEAGFPSLYEELKDRWEKLMERKAVRVKLPFPTIEECMFYDNSVTIKWGTGTKKAASCDGRVCSISFSVKPENGKNKYTFDRTPNQPCKVGEDGTCPMGCIPKALLKLVIPDLYPGGVVVFPLGSPIDINTIRGALASVEKYGLNVIPFTLLRKPARVNFTDDRGEQSRDNWGVNLVIDPVVASRLMGRDDRRFEKFLNSDSDIIEAVEVQSQRSIAPASTQSPKFKPSDDGFNFLQQVRAAISEGSTEMLNDAIEIATDLVESGFYDQPSGLSFIANEESRARDAIRSVQPLVKPVSPIVPSPKGPEVAEQTDIQKQVNFFRIKVELEGSEVVAIARSLKLPPSSSEMTTEQALALVRELLTQFATTDNDIDRTSAESLVSKSIERTNTDTALWIDFEQSIEAYVTENAA